MRRFIMSLLLLTAVAGNIYTYGQSTNKEREREVKVSGEYYYGEGVDAELKQSTQNAMDDLKLMILEAAMSSNVNLKTADFKGFEEDLELVTFDLEGRTKVLMFVPKSSVSFEMVSSTKAVIACNFVAAPKAEEPAVAAAEEVQIKVPVKETKVEEEPKIITITTNKPDLQPRQEPAPQPQAEPVATTTYGSASATYGTSTPSTTYAEAAPSSAAGYYEQQNPNVGATRPEPRQPMRTSEPIINQLLSVRQYEAARQILNENKLNGKLMYGQLATLSSPQNCYFLVLRNREVIDVLDKSDRSERRSLITGNMIDYRTTSGVVLWVCILR